MDILIGAESRPRFQKDGLMEIVDTMSLNWIDVIVIPGISVLVMPERESVFLIPTMEAMKSNMDEGPCMSYQHTTSAEIRASRRLDRRQALPLSGRCRKTGPCRRRPDQKFPPHLFHVLVVAYVDADSSAMYPSISTRSSSLRRPILLIVKKSSHGRTRVAAAGSGCGRTSDHRHMQLAGAT